MKRQITFRQYRAMDLFLFTALLCICETLITFAATRWFPGQPYTLCITPAVTAIVLVRWGPFAAIPAVAGSFAFCVASGATLQQYAIYCIGSQAALALLGFTAGKHWQRLHNQVLLTFLHGALAALLMQLGRALIALMLGHSLAACGGFIATDTLSTLLAALVTWIARKLDGMLEEQKHYLLRVAEEQKREQDARDNDPWQ